MESWQQSSTRLKSKNEGFDLFEKQEDSIRQIAV
jgi:hypothetical protein